MYCTTASLLPCSDFLALKFCCTSCNDNRGIWLGLIQYKCQIMVIETCCHSSTNWLSFVWFVFTKSKSYFCPTVQRKIYHQPTHIAQSEEPWCRLHDAATLASTLRSVTHCESQVTKPKSQILTLGNKYSSLSVTAAFSLNISPWETAWTFSSSLCMTITMTPSRRSTRCHTRRKQCLSTKGRQVRCWPNNEMSICFFYVGLVCFVSQVQFHWDLFFIFLTWIYREQKDVQEKAQEEDIQVWVDPQRNSIHSIK